MPTNESYTSVWIYIYIYIHIYTYIYIYIHAYICVYIYIYIYGHIHIYIERERDAYNTNIYTYVCIYNIYIYICVIHHTSLSIYIYIYTYTHTHAHTLRGGLDNRRGRPRHVAARRGQAAARRPGGLETYSAVSLPRLSLLTLLDSNFPENSLWTLNFHPLTIQNMLESNPLKSRILVQRLARRPGGLETYLRWPAATVYL